MAEQWLGIVVSGSSVCCVHVECDDSEGNTLVNQFTWARQKGDVATAYSVLLERLQNYVKENSIGKVVIKASAVGAQRPTLSHLSSAELRGVISVAAKLGGASVSMIQKSVISRTFGSRKADEYISDDSFWTSTIDGDIAKTRREAALLILSQRSL